jgi:hypothetical protein
MQAWIWTQILTSLMSKAPRLVPGPFQVPVCNQNLPPQLARAEVPSPGSTQSSGTWQEQPSWCSGDIKPVTRRWKHHPPNPRWTPGKVAGGLRQRLRGQQSFWEAGLLSKPAVTQRTHVQRPSPENKGGFPYIPLCNWNSRLGMLSQWQGGENSSPPEILQEGSDRDRAPKLSGSKFIKQNSSNSA